jgi:plasmid stabilization system protein ParE
LSLSAYAKQELDDVVRYLELEFEGLGKRFKAEVKKAAKRIAEHPEAWSVERGDVRKCLLHKSSRFAHIFLGFLKFSSHLNGNKWSFLGIYPHSRIYSTLTWFQVGQPNHFSIDFYSGSGRIPDRISKTR